jgi:hypothetical protein
VDAPAERVPAAATDRPLSQQALHRRDEDVVAFLHEDARLSRHLCAAIQSKDDRIMKFLALLFAGASWSEGGEALKQRMNHKG